MTTITSGHSTKSVTPDPAQVELILSQVESLPTLPAVAMRLLECTTDEKSSARDVIDLVESDPSLSAKILSVANRADTGTAVDAVDRAVVLLGFDAVRNLVLSIQVFETFAHRVEKTSSGFDRVGFWKHSLAVGCAARLLAEMKQAVEAPSDASIPKPEEAFICGLLHDLGKVVLDACFPQSYARVIDKVEAWRGCIADEERAIFGVDHTLAGRRLALYWKLPAMIAECIWLHHHAPESTPTRIAYPAHVAIVQVADRLVRQMRIGYSGNYQFQDYGVEAVASLGLSDEVLGRVTSALPDMIEARAEMLGLERVTSKMVYQETLTQANAELARVNAILASTNRRLKQRSHCFDALCALNGGLGQEPSHEEVLRAAVRAVRLVTADIPMAAVGISLSRSLVIGTASERVGKKACQEVFPLALAEKLLDEADTGEVVLPISRLPGSLADRLTDLLGMPPARCWSIRDRSKWVGALVTSGETTVDVDESIRVLLASIASWLKVAEAGSVARQLNEELAEMNRRFVDSRNEVARIRSLAMVGEMAAGAAHELNNPLAVISGRAQLIARSGHEDVCRPAEVVVENAHRASVIVNELMDFAKPAPPQASEWSIAKLLGEVRRSWLEKNVLTENQFRLDLSDDTVKVCADESQMRMLFDEVIRNAVEAMRDHSAALLIVNCRTDVTDDRVVIRIEDNGCGMTPDVLERATDPFFSHRPAGRGRGLGLSRAARYAEINGGRIRLSSRAGEGTTVLVELPVAVSGDVA